MKNTLKTIGLPLTIMIFIYMGILGGDFWGNSTNNSSPDIKGNKILCGDISLGDQVISPGNSPGKITITGNLTLGSTAKYEAELKDLSGPGIGHDQIEVSGNIALSGTLDIMLDGYAPVNNDKFEILTFGGTLSGSFTSIQWPASMSTWSIDYGILFPGKVTIHGSNMALPVELLSFTVQKYNSAHQLSWQTVSETNNDYFILEHSTDASTFHSLQQLLSHGNSQSIQTYSYIHGSPAPGINYYRLQQVDVDGKATYSQIISLENQESNSVLYYPNPVSQVVYFSQPVQSVVIHDLYGSVVISSTGPQSKLDISHLASGTYLLFIDKSIVGQKLLIIK